MSKVLVSLGLLSIALHAETVTFKGVVSDSVNGMLIDSVTVSAGGASTLTDSKGAFTLTASATAINNFQSPVLFPALRWDPSNGTFSWNGYKGQVSITVHTLRGDLLARAGSENGSAYSMAQLPAGIYMISIGTKGQTSRFRINYMKDSQGSSFSLETETAARLKKEAASPTYAVTFTKGNFNTLTLPVPAASVGAIDAKMKSPYPLKNILKLFLDPTIPDQGPKESATTPDCGGNAEPVQTLPGGQLNFHNFIMVGENHRRINLVLNGKVAWNYDTENTWEDDEIWVLSNGNVLHAHMHYIEEVSPKKEIVWRFDNPAGTEIHTCQPIGVDKVLWLQNEDAGSVVKLYNKKTKTFEIDHRMLEYGGKVHTQCRRLRMTAQGTFVFGSMSQKTIAEYDKDFKLLNKFDAGSLWGAVPLKNGNYLLQREGLKEAAELDRTGKVVWSVSYAEIQPQLTTLAPGSVAVTATQTGERLSNGNTVMFTRYCTANLPQAIEVTPDKKVVWVLRDQKNLGDAATMQFLDEPGYPEIPGETNH
jgi:hypothetical protein